MSRTGPVGRLGRIATLGGPSTFAGQATTAFLAGAGSTAHVGFYPTMEDVWQALRSGEVDGIILTAESTHVGMTDVARAVLRDPELQVLGEVVLPYHCALLGKPGASLDQVTRVTGHGSLAQCRRYLARHLPSAEVAVHKANSVAAARQVLEGDGSLAVVGTLAAAAETGLAILAKDVDDGSSGSWWLIGPASTVPAQGDTAIVENSIGQNAWPTILCGSEPWLLRSVLVEPSGQALFEYLTLTAWTLPSAREGAEVPPPGGRIRGRFDSVLLQ
jgi:hypothetical protein